jgi:copper chaperone CopZ
MITESYRTPEVHCAACEASIRRALLPLPGVGSVAVDLPGKTVRVEFDPARVDSAAIRAAIENAGFDVEA